ncbi:MAG TPA: 16S rRNA (guanine(527)-N(7))-methyltransferase RsmG [Nitriliruptorales bacterium]|nr:16S rRNA (guanine(527)-N(7))-methyltransferase RsmG [Nitriliruptorales bacterium]
MPPAPSDLDTALAALARLIRASPHNLLSPRGLRELESRHLPESLALARRLPEGPATMVDIGSGGGLPGLVIALSRPDLAVTLVEATGKKARFLRDSARALGVTVDVVAGRVEDSSHGLQGRFDLATARAVAPLHQLVPWVMPVLRPGGLLYAVKGNRWAEELAQARRAIARSGAQVVATPLDDGHDVVDASVVIIARRSASGAGAAEAGPPASPVTEHAC